ncbi:hypothetical protein IWX47DRAFT_845873 [Phyllosticta citricarpa]
MSSNNFTGLEKRDPEVDQTLRSNTPYDEPLDSSGEIGDPNESADPVTVNSMETGTVSPRVFKHNSSVPDTRVQIEDEIDEEEWDPSMLEQMLVGDSDSTEIGSDPDPSVLEQVLEEMLDEDSDETELDDDVHPGWTHVLSPPFTSSRHSTPPEVMRWVNFPDIYDSFEYIFDNTHHFMRQSACLNRALRRVDYGVDLSAYKFPYAAQGGMRVMRPLPYPFRRRPELGATRLSEVETLRYTAANMASISLNVELQRWELEAQPETKEGSTSGGLGESTSNNGGSRVSSQAKQDKGTSEEKDRDDETSSPARKRARYS